VRTIASPQPSDRLGCAAPGHALALSWSGGKDSALTLHALRDDGIEPTALITTVTEGYDGFVFCDC
jgi:tRNA(Ile)-lysidine synthase TilS/MesJ